MTLLIGTAGVPSSSRGRDTLLGIERIKAIGLGAMEVEWVRGLRMSDELASKVNKLAKHLDVKLTGHGPYWINLNASEKEKFEQSKQRVLKTARTGFKCGCTSVTFHTAYYMKQEPKVVYEKLKKILKDICKTLENEGTKVKISLETTGKESQFGTVNEILSLSQEIDMIGICVDFAHVFARSIGKINSYDQFREILVKIENKLGKKAIKNMHIHLSGIEYGNTGERNHLFLEQSKLNYKDVLRALKDFKAEGILITESPDPQADALLVQRVYRSL
ncbi:MAG: TIM barrel protein [Candidatus Woesearchaeota archaeon]|nr:MAG: TIM barrel protein [Candidatus Woesearchaeota archaeon]